MDKFDSETRSRIMSAIKGKETVPEKQVSTLVKSLGIRHKCNVNSLPGTPDIVVGKLQSVIFVHGCFWHQHSCSVVKQKPATNQEYWFKKFARNIARDKQNIKELKALGWKVLVVWECQIKKTGSLRKRLAKFLGTQLRPEN